MFNFLKKKTEDKATHPASSNPPADESSEVAIPPVPAAAAREPSVPGAVAAVQIPPQEHFPETEAAPSQAAVPSGDDMEIVVPPRHDPSAILAEFEREIERQQDRVYGIALFFECVSLLHAGQPGVLDTNRKQFRNIIVAGHTAIGQARVLAAKARQDPSAIDDVRAFRFIFCEGHSNPIGLAARADALLNAFRRIHPDRPLDKPFTEEETYRLLESASGIISPVMQGT